MFTNSNRSATQNSLNQLLFQQHVEQLVGGIRSCCSHCTPGWYFLLPNLPFPWCSMRGTQWLAGAACLPWLWALQHGLHTFRRPSSLPCLSVTLLNQIFILYEFYKSILIPHRSCGGLQRLNNSCFTRGMLLGLLSYFQQQKKKQKALNCQESTCAEYSIQAALVFPAVDE